MGLAYGEREPTFVNLVTYLATLAPRPFCRPIKDPGSGSHLRIITSAAHRPLIAMPLWADEIDQVSHARRPSQA